MDEGLRKYSNNSWVVPLPFKCPCPHLPNNRHQALKRLMSLKRNLQRKPVTREHFLSFMDKIFKNGHAELAPPLGEREEQWYLPTFGVYHPKKPNQIRVVFDSSAQHSGISLDDVLLTGPDLNNTLLGDNDLSKDIVDYHMRVHVFGNSPSPAVAIYCLHQSVHISDFHVDPDVKHFVMHDFYVDDGLKYLLTVEAANSLLKKTQDVLSKSNLRLHKVAANNKEVMEDFPSTDCAGDLIDLDLEADTLPMKHSLGLNWDLHTDCFLFGVCDAVKPYTRRGVLSTINSLYDLLGFVAPVTIKARLF
ncbi:Heat-inducible transcription repressor HrcA [Labeo rohita]|uniref:Heat-inducible transcription repressor HrcA n=1 Tax=Labeo rohita TaxID=84645 RepID=A0ABQ8LZX3_LABRO|nr:Heat-inducible transcription repressor HrcA [Labeo rohita]